jgi:hypothetical protein
MPAIRAIYDSNEGKTPKQQLKTKTNEAKLNDT